MSMLTVLTIIIKELVSLEHAKIRFHRCARKVNELLPDVDMFGLHQTVLTCSLKI